MQKRLLEQAKRYYQKAWNESRDAKNPTGEGGGKYSLLVKDMKGNVTSVDPAKTTREQTRNYMVMSRKGQLDQYTYFPVSLHTSKTVISTLRNAGVEITDKPLAMQAKKARQSQNKGQHIEHDGTIVRHHALTPEEIQEVIDKLDDPIAAIHQQDRVKKKVEDEKVIYVPAPDNFAFFVTLDSGKECVAVIEFDSYIDETRIKKDGHGDDYHTTVTVFEPDQYRDGEEFDYIEYLAVQPSNRELEIKTESPETETANSQTQATVSEKELSNARISQGGAKVKSQFSLGKDDLAQKIVAELSQDFYDNDESWGFRADDYDYTVGDRVANSHELYQDAEYDDDGELLYPEGEGQYRGFYDAGELNGASSIGINTGSLEALGRNVAEALKRVSAYDGKYLYLISGSFSEGGNDIGEEIIHNPVVRKKYLVNKDGTFSEVAEDMSREIAPVMSLSEEGWE